MAGTSTLMQIKAIDQEQNLFRVEDAMPPDLVRKVLATEWLSLPWKRQEGQENWARRRIDESAIPWIAEWNTYCEKVWPDISVHLGRNIGQYQGTAFWLDEPGFTCTMHTDGELPGSMHLTWYGTRINHGTAFYWNKDVESLRHQFPCVPNTGYIMINKEDDQGFRKLLWHAMLEPVPANSYRITSYSWLTPQ